MTQGMTYKTSAGGESRAVRHRRRRGFLRLAGLRCGHAGIVAILVMTLTFVLIHLTPGDPATMILGTQATPASIAALRTQLHLNEPLLQQFLTYTSGVLHGNLGMSLVITGQTVTHIVFSAFWVTLKLTLLGIVLSLIIGVPIGLWAGLTGRPVVGHAIRAGAVIGLVIPTFYFGLLLLFVVALQFRLAPAGGWGSGFGGELSHLWLPSVAIAGTLAPLLVRMVRQRTLEVRGTPFIEAAKGRGVSRSAVTIRHVLPHALLPVITFIGYNLGAYLGGAVVIEAIFALPGLGTVLVQAVESRDYPVLQGATLVIGIVVVAANLLADIVLLMVDPRRRTS